MEWGHRVDVDPGVPLGSGFEVDHHETLDGSPLSVPQQLETTMIYNQTPTSMTQPLLECQAKDSLWVACPLLCAFTAVDNLTCEPTWF
jgi:hypothetical protein